MQKTIAHSTILDRDPQSDGSGFDAVQAEHLADLLGGADAGLAMFSQDLTLLFANDRYGELCGYSKTELTPGVNLADLATFSLERTGAQTGTVEDIVQRLTDRLKAGGSYTFRFDAPSGKSTQVCRRRLESGRIVETVRELEDNTGGSAGDDRMELLATAARSRMDHALNSMPDGFSLFDADDKLLVYNRQYVDLHPHIADVVKPGHSYEFMLREGVERSAYDTDGMDKEEFVRWRMDQRRTPGEPYDIHMTDGRWVRVHETRTRDGGTVGIRSDITELKQREAETLRVNAELRRGNMQFDTVLNNMVQGLCLFDFDQKLIVCNRRYLEMYGFSPEVLKPGISLSEIMAYSVRLRNYTRAEAERAKAERPDHAKLRKQSTLKQFLRDGRVIAVMHQPMPDGGSIATYQDISDIEHYQAALRIHARKLEEGNRDLQNFAEVASYDLQEPLRKIETFGTLLRAKLGDEIPEGADVYVDRMQFATARMRRLMDDLLAYSNVTTKAKPFELVDLNEQVERILSDPTVGIEENSATVEFDNLTCIYADPNQLRQLLRNMIENSVKFRKPGVDPFITISSDILPGDLTNGMIDRCQLKITDNGIGLDNKYRDQIFTIFQRLHGQKDFDGTGIGLAICRKIALRHNGTISAEGIPGEGATFIITLPVKHMGLELKNEAG